MDWGIDFKFLLMNPSLLFALLTILLMCGFQERLIYWFLCVCVCVYVLSKQCSKCSNQGWGCGRDGCVEGDGVVVYIGYWRCPKGAIVRLMSCNAPLKVSRLLWTNTLEGSLFHWAIVCGKKLYL